MLTTRNNLHSNAKLSVSVLILSCFLSLVFLSTAQGHLNVISRLFEGQGQFYSFQ